MAKTFGHDPRSWAELSDYAPERGHADWRNDVLSFLLYGAETLPPLRPGGRARS